MSVRTSATRPPSVERLLALARPALGDRAADAVLAEARAIIDAERSRLAVGEPARPVEDLARELASRLEAFGDPLAAGQAGAINATGVIVHTNLGRAPWPPAAIDAAKAAASGPLLLEMDRDSGRRGSRFRLAEEHLIALTGAEDALIANNNAAALALTVGLAGRAGRVVVSRGELVEIGGGVRIPDIVRRAGARLIEVGTTNRTRVADFAGPLEDGARLVLRVHPSNFRQSGFVETPDPRRAGGARPSAWSDRRRRPRQRRPARHRRLRARPRADARRTPRRRRGSGHVQRRQAGRWSAGRPHRRSREPHCPPAQGSARAGDPPRQDDARRAGRDPWSLPGRARRARDPGLADDRRATGRPASTGRGTRRTTRRPSGRRAHGAVDSTIGGGSLPGETLPSWAVALPGSDTLLGRLRRGRPAVIGRVESARVLLDLRTVDPAHDSELVRAVAAATTGAGPGR